MKAEIKGSLITCPICNNKEFYVTKSVTIQATKRKDYEDKLHNIIKDELECNNCGWTGYFENKLDLDKNYSTSRITYFD